MDDEWEEEEQLVVVELAGTLSNNFLKGNSTCKVLDIDSDKPFMQVGQFVFAGEYEDALGTSVLFEELPQKAGKDCAPELKYMCHTVKKLMMQRVFLTEKTEGETSQGDSGDGGEQDDTTILLSDDDDTGAQLDDTHNTVDVDHSLLD